MELVDPGLKIADSLLETFGYLRGTVKTSGMGAFGHLPSGFLPRKDQGLESLREARDLCRKQVLQREQMAFKTAETELFPMFSGADRKKSGRALGARDPRQLLFHEHAISSIHLSRLPLGGLRSRLL
jgi:hypothetical protein